jgi:hypothetical protein
VACGDDDDSAPPPDNGTVNEQAISQAAGTTFQATETAVGGDGQGAAFQMLAVGASAMSYVQPAAAQQQGLEIVTQAQTAGTCECTANGCTFTDCGAEAGGYILTGTMAWTDSSLDCDYNVAGDQGGQVFDYSILCDLDFTPTSLAGSLATAGSITMPAAGQAAATSWNTSMIFNSVTYAAGQPTGGSIDVTASINQGGQNYSSTSSVPFGG